MIYLWFIGIIIFLVLVLVLAWKNLTGDIKKLEDENRKLKSKIAFQEEKKKIKEEVFGEAKKVSEKLNSNNNDERFNAACGVLCQQKK